ncbi:MAG: Unknown protein [uncultured Sulfurovum sp.]|uniref:Uncharacterized protein n=1 Tax=uncultured Sulfurovum sp. TaxID=269237 RepID=A0A6S6TTZ2_9BACT|nr:MAG: Unknown protein [uncultured Sulfurovum sp.]
MEHVSLEHSVEIILTPEFYTLIREELDIKFAYQAKQIAQSLFDDYLDNSKEYQYHVAKHEGAWYFYAYSIQEIEKFVENIGLEKHRISKIYFAQELSKELEEPIQLNNKTILQSIEGIVTSIPSRLMDPNADFKLLNLTKVKLSSGVSMGASHNSLFSFKQTILLSSMFLILGTVFIFEGNRIKASISKEDGQLMALIDENPSYGSTLLRENILEKYQPIDKNERAKRQSIKEVSKLLSAKSELTTLKIEKSTIKVNIKTSDIKISKQVDQSAKANNFKSTTSGQTVKVEKSL